ISKQLDGVVAATPHISERFSRINQNTVNVNNYPLPYELAPPADAYERRNQVCYVGGLSRIRGIKPLIEALEFIPGIRLVLCGQFSDRSFESELRLLHGWGQVDYRGQVERPEVRVVMSESIAGVLTYFPEPNHIEAQPNKLFEYMSAGLPVIASDFPHWRQIIDGVGAGQCVDPKSPEAIAGAIQELMNQPEIAAKMGKAGRQAVMERYNWPTEADKLITYYKGLL
ncbi:MAG: glycosyltransferase, partial [Gammaproteobacteria bacterium]